MVGLIVGVAVGALIGVMVGEVEVEVGVGVKGVIVSMVPNGSHYVPSLPVEVHT